MDRPVFRVQPINLESTAIQTDRGTVAYVSPQGYVDWILPNLESSGATVTTLQKEPHLCWVLGTKFNLHFCHLTEEMDAITFDLLEGGARLCITARSHSTLHRLAAEHKAELTVNPKTGRYEWLLVITLRSTGTEPVELPWIEYTNVYPQGCGRCMLFAPQKVFDRTLLVDGSGTVWEFPHQHLFHYRSKIAALSFTAPALAGFFGEELNPVVETLESPFMPDWAICDMFYDLHCGARIDRPIQPGETLVWRARIFQMTAEESAGMVRSARRIPIVADDYRKHHYPRFELGKNAFHAPTRIDGVDDASGFRPAPPVKVWDREIGKPGCGALRIFNEQPAQTVWSAEPPTQIPAGKTLRLTAAVKTEGVTGRGLFLRIRYHTFEWRPEPHVTWKETLESIPVNGTSDWSRITVPALRVPLEDFDYLVWIDLVLEGAGTGWLTDVDVDLKNSDVTAPVAPWDLPTRGGRPVGRRS